MNRSVIGFDRRLELTWLELAATIASEDGTPAQARAALLEGLRSQGGQKESSAALAKTANVLMRLWIRPAPQRRSHRDRGLLLLKSVKENERVWLHWGTAVATYPFFYEAANFTGRLLALQDTVSLSTLTLRMKETWGDRSTMRRAIQRVIRSMVAWGTLAETLEPGIFTMPSNPSRPTAEVAAWLLEAALYTCGAESISLHRAATLPCLFPFRIELSLRDIRTHQGLELHREGGDRDVLTLNPSMTGVFAG